MASMIRIQREEVARLKELAGLRSDAALARAAGMSRQHLNQILLGHIDANLSSLSKICIALSCQPGDILEEFDTLTP